MDLTKVKPVDTDDALYCVGCGEFIARAVPGQTLAISCRCGASAPILITSSGFIYSMPGSMQRVVSKFLDGEDPENRGHYEYYLGFSDHTGEDKEVLKKILVAMGMTSMADCSEERCQEGPTRFSEGQRRVNNIN